MDHVSEGPRSRGRAAVFACAMWVSVSLTHTADAKGQAARSPLAQCERPAGAAWTYQELLCLVNVGQQHHVLDQARRRLRRLGGGTIQHPWATLALAHATFEQDESRGIALYELAAAGFVRSGEAYGEVVARQNLRSMYRLRGSSEAARRQVERAVAVAEASGEPLTIARALVMQAGEAIQAGGDLGSAYRGLRRAERLAFPDGPIGLRRSILMHLGHAALDLGRLEEAIEAFERHRALRAVDGSSMEAALAAFNVLNAQLTLIESRPVAGARDRLIASAQAVADEAIALQQPAVEARVRRVLGELVGARDPALAETHLRRCLELEASLGYPDLRATCLWSLALHEATRNPARAEELSREALTLVGTNRDRPMLAYAWQSRLRLVWRTLPEEQAISESLEAVEAIERLRAGQRDAASRATLFSNWTRDYYWLTGRLLEAQVPRLAQAFTVGERLRSRVLLEYLVQAGVTPPADPDRDAARQLLAQRIANTQRRLLSSVLGEPERRTLLDQLQLLELERAELDEGRVAAVAPSALPFVSLEDIQRALGETEALLWFSIAPWKDLYDDFGGGAWVVVVTRKARTVHRLSTAVELDTQVAALTGLLRDRSIAEHAWTGAARHLGRTLLGGAIASLPREIGQLVIVSDGVLHRVPFEALPFEGGSTRLGDRFEISIVPSATLWLRLRYARTPPGAGRALVLADPELSQPTGGGDLRLPPLPWARQEAQAISRLLGPGAAHVLMGGAATERWLKHAPLASFQVLHLAAHARADPAFPERSAVFLTPGDDGEDGWLQPREIARLPLGGRLVVLSACESADGSLLSGEGPLSLARAFFAAGAGGVIATRWPLRDDDAAFMMERLYRALRAGDHVGAALRRARADAIRAGLPPGAWAGVALLGDGFYRPFQRPPDSSRSWPLAVGSALTLAAAVFAWWRSGRSGREIGEPTDLTNGATEPAEKTEN
jgi:CHAT domain-containing protein